MLVTLARWVDHYKFYLGSKSQNKNHFWNILTGNGLFLRESVSVFIIKHSLKKRLCVYGAHTLGNYIKN